MMQKLLAIALSAALALPAQAGGPVLVEEAYEAEPTQSLTPGEKIAIAAGILLVGALLFGGGGSGPIGCTCNGEPEDGGGCDC